MQRVAPLDQSGSRRTTEADRPRLVVYNTGGTGDQGWKCALNTVIYCISGIIGIIQSVWSAREHCVGEIRNT